MQRAAPQRMVMQAVLTRHGSLTVRCASGLVLQIGALTPARSRPDLAERAAEAILVAAGYVRSGPWTVRRDGRRTALVTADVVFVRVVRDPRALLPRHLRRTAR
jgi:hypothetical protein